MSTIGFLATNPAFSMASLTGWVRNKPNLPQMISGMNLFTPKPVRTKQVFMDQDDGVLNLVGFTERGSAPTQAARGSRKTVTFDIPRMATSDKVWAHEIANLRASGSETELMAVMGEVNTRLDNMRSNMAYSDEYLQLAAIQGKVLDPTDGATTVNYFTELGITPATAVSFELDVATTKVKQIAEELKISIQRTAKGAWVMGQSKVVGLVGDDFWFALTQHPLVEKYYASWSAMAILKDLDPSQEFEFGGITFKRFIGSDDNSEVAIATAEAKFFVQGGRDIFVKAMAPADEHFDFVNQLGKSMYVIPKNDFEYANAPRFMEYELKAYPLYMCQRPNTLRTGTLT